MAGQWVGALVEAGERRRAVEGELSRIAGAYFSFVTLIAPVFSYWCFLINIENNKSFNQSYYWNKEMLHVSTCRSTEPKRRLEQCTYCPVWDTTQPSIIVFVHDVGNERSIIDVMTRDDHCSLFHHVHANSHSSQAPDDADTI